MSQNFGSREASVRLYCTVPAFVAERGSVRLRGSDEPYIYPSTPVRDAKGVFALAAGRVGILLRIDRDILRGSGRPLGPVVGKLVGIAPDDQLKFQSVQGHPVRITFPSTSNAGPTLGSIRSVAMAADGQLGDFITLVLDLSTRMMVTTVTDPAEHEPGWPLVARLTGIDQESGLDGLASALECLPAEAGSVLIRRGDQVVADAIPPRPSSESSHPLSVDRDGGVRRW